MTVRDKTMVLTVNLPLPIYEIVKEYKKKSGLNYQAMLTLAVIKFFQLEEKGFSSVDTKKQVLTYTAS